MQRWNNFRISAQKKTQMKVIREFLVEYCSNTTVHGVRYFTERRRHWTERCWWIIAIVLSIWFCGSLIQNTWIKWCDSPIRMSLNEKPLPISAIPFPTVTVCPEIKTYKSKFDVNAITDLPIESWNVSEIEFARSKALAHICHKIWVKFDDSNDQFANASIFDLFDDMAPFLDDTLRQCRFPHERKKLCSDLFVPILTEEGLCFGFNALNSNEIYTDEIAPELLTVTDRPTALDWSLENGYKNRSDDSSYPLYVYGARRSTVLGFYLRAYDTDVEYSCRTLVPGFKLYLHTPGNPLKSSDRSIRIPFTEAVQISIKPQMTTTSEGLRSYSPNQRQCFFNSDRQLRFFRFYSEENCELECLANYTLKECGCVKFSMPRNETTKICGTAKIRCYKNAHRNLFMEDLIDGLSDENARSFRQKCNCIPACTTIIYESEVDRAISDWRKALERTYNRTYISHFQMSRISIFFEYHHLSPLKRVEQYTYTDFLAICGGLLGLCLGVSALSIIECIYYSTLRVYWSIHRRKTENAVVPR